MSSLKFSNTALLVIDVQMAFAHADAKGEPRSTPEAEQNIAALLEYFRQHGGRVIHIHHHSRVQGSAFTAGLPGAVVQEFARPQDGEALYLKHENSAFIGTSLESDMRAAGVKHLIMCGATANHCVETTTRMAGNLGFDTYYIADGVWAYGATGPDGRRHSPQDIQSVSMCNLNGEFATVLSAQQLLESLSPSAANLASV